MPIKPNYRHFERRTTRNFSDKPPKTLDRRDYPANTPTGTAKRIELISDNYAQLLLKAKRERGSNTFKDQLRERYEEMRTRHLDRLISFSERDEGTDLLNKRGFKLRIRHYITNPDRVFSYTYIDLNNLKRVNDTFGHTVGNTYLRCMGLAAKELAQKYEKSDIKFTIGRTGGDEFEMLISNPRRKGFNYESATKRVIDDLYTTAKRIWKEQKRELSDDWHLDIPELEFAAGYSIGVRPCDVKIKNVQDYKNTSERDLQIIDSYIENLRTTAERNMYKNKAEMKSSRK